MKETIYEVVKRSNLIAEALLNIVVLLVLLFLSFIYFRYNQNCPCIFANETKCEAYSRYNGSYPITSAVIKYCDEDNLQENKYKFKTTIPSYSTMSDNIKIICECEDR